MSMKVELEDLGEHIDRYGPAAFLVSTGDDQRPHTTHVVVFRDGDALTCAVGGKTARNIAARPGVALLFPAPAAGEFSLIVDADATVDGAAGTARVAPARAVLHRNALAAEGGYAADCVRLERPA